MKCPAFVNLRALDRRYKFVKYCTLHNHDMHLLNPRLYVPNLRPTVKLEEHLSKLMCTLRNARAVFRYGCTTFNSFFTNRDVNNLRTRLRRLGLGNNDLKVKQVVGGQGILRTLTKDNVFRFHVPQSALPLVDKHADVISAEAKHQASCWD